jgi:nucleotide-binding universal stress UspA family protein
MGSTEESVVVGIKSVLVAYDFSDVSRKPLDHALSIARHFRAKVYIAYIISSIGYEIAGPEATQLAYEGSMRDAERLETRLVESGVLRNLEYEFMVREGNVWDQLKSIVQQKHIDAVVIGTHARQGLGRLVLGSVAEQIFRQADCLVLTVGPGSHDQSLIVRNGAIGPFLFATDFGSASLKAFTYAASFAHHFRTKLVVLNVLPVAPIPESFHWSRTGDLAEMRKRAELESRKLFEQLVVSHVHGDAAVEFVVSFGMPKEQILETCHRLKADLLVLGLNASTHAETASHLPWTVAHEIVFGARCPVLTLKKR